MANFKVNPMDDTNLMDFSRWFKNLDEDQQLEAKRLIGQHIVQAAEDLKVKRGIWRTCTELVWMVKARGLPDRVIEKTTADRMRAFLTVQNTIKYTTAWYILANVVNGRDCRISLQKYPSLQHMLFAINTVKKHFTVKVPTRSGIYFTEAEYKTIERIIADIEMLRRGEPEHCGGIDRRRKYLSNISNMLKTLCR